MKIALSLFNYGQGIAPVDWNTKDIPTPYRLYYIKGGSAFLRIDNEEFKLKKDHFYFFPSSFPFFIRQDPKDRLNHIFYDFIMQPSMISSKPVCCSNDAHPLFEHFINIMEYTTKNYKITYSQEAKDISTKVLESFLSVFFSFNKINLTKGNEILKCIEYMETNYQQNITIKDIANSLFISEDHLIRKFKKNMGMTPYSYLSRLRLNIARDLIKSVMTLNDTAEAVGFKSASSLCHALKK